MVLSSIVEIGDVSGRWVVVLYSLLEGGGRFVLGLQSFIRTKERVNRNKKRMLVHEIRELGTICVGFMGGVWKIILGVNILELLMLMGEKRQLSNSAVLLVSLLLYS